MHSYCEKPHFEEHEKKKKLLVRFESLGLTLAGNGGPTTCIQPVYNGCWSVYCRVVFIVPSQSTALKWTAIE